MRTTAETSLTKTVRCVSISIANVLKANSSAETRSAYLPDGAAITTMTVTMDQMKRSVSTIPAKKISSSVGVVTVFHKNLSAMEIKTAKMSQMRLTVQHVSRTAASARSLCFNAIIPFV